MKINKKPLRYSLCILLCAVLFSTPYLAISFIENDLSWVVKAAWEDPRFRGVFLIEVLGSIALGASGIALTDIIID